MTFYRPADTPRKTVDGWGPLLHVSSELRKADPIDSDSRYAAPDHTMNASMVTGHSMGQNDGPCDHQDWRNRRDPDRRSNHTWLGSSSVSESQFNPQFDPLGAPFHISRTLSNPRSTSYRSGRVREPCDRVYTSVPSPLNFIVAWSGAGN